MSTSLSASLRNPKVVAGHANSAASERYQDHTYAICPAFNGQDSLGRPIDPWTWNTTTAGCHSAEPVMTVEELHRPNYHVYLNTDGINAGGTWSIDRSNEYTFGRQATGFGHYDAMGVRRDEAYGGNARLNLPVISRAYDGHPSESLLEKQRYTDAMRRKHQTIRMRNYQGM